MSLRARLIIGLVSLAAVGLLLLGGITYAIQSDLLYGRVDQQVKDAIPVVDRALRDHGVGGAPIRDAHARDALPASGVRGGTPVAAPDPGSSGRAPSPDHDPRTGEGRPPDSHHPSLPSTLYGQGRDASGKVLLSDTPLLAVGATAPSPPRLPADMRPGERLTVGAQDPSGPRYRVLAARSSTKGLTIAAVPLNEVDDALTSLLLGEALVISGVLLGLAAAAWWTVRIGLRPLDRIEETAGAIAPATSRGASSRPSHAPRSGASAWRSTRCSLASSRRSPSAAPARSACAASSPTPRTSCARRSPRSAATPSCFASGPPVRGRRWRRR